MIKEKEKPSVFASEKDLFFYNLYNNLPIGAMVLNSNMTILTVNESIRKYFSFSPSNIGNSLIGDALRCGNLENGRLICGQTAKCKKCILYNGIIRIMKEKVSMDDIVIKHPVLTNNSKQIKWFNVSGIPASYENEVYAVLFFVDITKYKQQELFLLEKLKLDLATDAMNKHSLLKFIRDLINSEKKQSFIICMTDFDNFKKINDQYGHVMGDKVLKVFSRISRKNIRANDILGRYGGEEFIFIFLETDTEHAAKIIGRIQNEIRNYFANILPHPVTFSAGLVHVDTESLQFSGCTHLIEQVDKFLYEAKKHGKNRIVTIDKEYTF